MIFGLNCSTKSLSEFDCLSNNIYSSSAFAFRNIVPSSVQTAGKNEAEKITVMLISLQIYL